MYSIPQHIDSNKMFIVNRSDIEGRFDPKYIEPIRLAFYSKLRKSKNVIRLKDVIKEGSYGILPPGDSYDENHPIKFIRATELKEDLKIDFENVFYVDRKYYTKRASIKKNDILLAVKGATIAGVKCTAFVNEDVGECIVNGSIYRMQTKENVNPQYVAFLLNSDLLKKQMKFNLVANNAVDYLDKSLIYNLLIPLPSLIKQNNIVEIYQTAYTQKQQKEAQAKELLASIDSYLLNKLGIELPEQDNSLESRIFITRFSEISGERFDPSSFSERIIMLRKIFCNRFKDCLLDLYRYPTFFGIDYKTEGTKIIKGESIDKEGNIDLYQKFDYVDEDIHSKYNRTQLNYNDLVFTVRGLIGKVGIYKSYVQANINANVMKITLSKSVNKDFYWNYLNSAIGQELINSLTSGQVQKTITVNDILNIPIPLPPIEKQNEIAEYIQNIRLQAKQLQEEANHLLESAKQDVEKMILGE